ncbi:MAG: tyrosine--tRNA ligase [Archaeoglobaceae archaeon]|nr:tyrosine--tRNA ligase [Archaeoglobaceae archaeon]
MDLETRIELVKSVACEIVTEEDLRTLFETKSNPVAYDGFEPSGLAHLPVGVYRPLVIEKLMKAGIRFKLLLADTFAWINNKMGGDLEKIRDAGRYFVEVWRAAGVDLSRVEVVWHKDLFDDPEYWKKVILIAKNTTMKRTVRALTVAGRLDSESNPTAFLFYPIMQCADIFQLGVDICQLGIDQRKVNVLAREVASILNAPKPIAIHHPLLLGLSGVSGPKGFDENTAIDTMISSKMSKSIPESAIFVHDSFEEIRSKLRRAFCPQKDVKNPVIDLAEKIVFPKFGELVVETKKGDVITFGSIWELKSAYLEEKIHPLDLKESLANYLEKLIRPIREHFEKDRRARELYEKVRSFEVTR